MWKRGIARAQGLYTGGPTRRRGAKLGLLIALLAVIPGLVAGTAFINTPTTPNFTGNQTGVSTADCGFNVNGGSTDASYVTMTGTQDTAGKLYVGSVVVTTSVIQGTGTSGYQYLEGEVYFGCYNTPNTGGTITAAITVSGTGISGVTTTSADWAALRMTSDTGSTTTDESAPTNWCNPVTSTIATGACSATAPTACTYTGSVFTPSLFSPENKVLGAYASTNTWMWVNGVVAGAQAGAAGQCGGATLPSLTIVKNIATTMEYYLDIGFAFGDMPASVTNAAWTFTATITMT